MLNFDFEVKETYDIKINTFKHLDGIDTIFTNVVKSTSNFGNAGEFYSNNSHLSTRK